jgi:hypothetical protein
VGRAFLAANQEKGYAPLIPRAGGRSVTKITDNHVEWAVVDRLRCMLEEPPHQSYNVTQTYALFTTVLCWVVQRIRIPTHEISTQDDRIANKLFKTLSAAGAVDEPWRIPVSGRIERIGAISVPVPAAVDFEEHTIRRFLINLRDATAHGDARNVLPFNVQNGSECLLAGFTFLCQEKEKGTRKIIWEGKITLVENDMRRIGSHLANAYCNALRRSERHRRDSHFPDDAASIRETAA